MNKFYLQLFAEDEGTTTDNTIMSADLEKVKEVDFTEMFSAGIGSLMNMLGISRKIAKTPGSQLMAYKVTGELESGVVAEGEVIPLSKYETSYEPVGEVILKKWRKRTTIESIVEKGKDQAINDTDARMLKDIQNGIRADFTGFLTGARDEDIATTSGAGFQAAIANAWGKLQVLFEDTSIEAVYLVNPMDAAAYLGGAQITTQNAFGMRYISDFLGLGTIILDATITQGTIFATAKDNIVLYYVPVGDTEVASTFNLTTDVTGLVGINNNPDNNSGAVNTVAYSGVGLFAEMLGGIVKSTISAA